MSFFRDNDDQNGVDIHVTGNTIQGYYGDQQPSTKVRKTADVNQAKYTPEMSMSFLNNSVHLTDDGQRLPSALKRSPSLQRKSVSFIIPDATAPDSEDEDFLPKDIDDISPSIDAIAKAQKIALISNPRTSSTLIPNNVQPVIQPTQPVIQPVHPEKITVKYEFVKERLPTLQREQLDVENESSETNTQATFKSLRSKLRGMAPVRVRKSEPKADPLKICLHCQLSLATHLELKRIVDKAIHYFQDAKVTSLQFDPLAVWSGDPAAQSRWIISLSDADACNYLSRTGLNVHGEHYRVDSYDDVVLKEFEVYRMKQNILQAGKRKPLILD